MNENSRKITQNKSKYYNTINNISSSNKKKSRNKINAFERLYNDGKLHEKKISKLTKTYYFPFFKPNINQSYSFNKAHPKIKSKPKNTNNKLLLTNFSSYYDIRKNNIAKNINNITKKLKKQKSYTMIFEDINLPNNKNKKSRNSKKDINNIRTTNSTRGSYSNKKIIKINPISSKIFPSQINDISPLPIKLGEIQELDSAVVGDSSNRNRNKDENKKKNSITSESAFGKNQNNPSVKNPIFKNNNINAKEEENEEEKNDNEKHSKSKKSYSKKGSKNKFSSKNTPKISAKNSAKNSREKSNSKEVKKNSKISKISNQKLNQFLSNNSQSFNDNQKKDNNEKTKNKLNLLISKDQSDILLNNNNQNKDNLLFENSLINDSGSFGKYQNSNILENLSGQKLKERDYLINKKNKKKKTGNNNENEKNNEESNSSSSKPKNKDKNKNKYKFDAYNNVNNNSDYNSNSFEENYPLNEGDNALLEKIKMIEEKESKSISKNNINYIDKNGNDNKNNINLYMLNFRESAPNSVKEPFTITDTKGIFFEFFKKK